MNKFAKGAELIKVSPGIRSHAVSFQNLCFNHCGFPHQEEIALIPQLLYYQSRNLPNRKASWELGAEGCRMN